MSAFTAPATPPAPNRTASRSVTGRALCRFWGSGSPASLAAIKTFTTKLGAKAPTVYYSMGGFTLGAGGTFGGKQNATLNKEMKAMGIKLHATIGATNITELRGVFAEPEAYVQAAVKAAVAADIDGFNLVRPPHPPPPHPTPIIRESRNGRTGSRT